MNKIICFKCSSESNVKNGCARGAQRYKCKACGYNFTVDHKGRGKPESQKRQALHMYLEGLGFRGIARILGVSNVAVLNWIRSFGEKIKELRKEVKPQEVEVMELDEMWHFVQKKRNNNGFGLLMIGSENDQLPSSVAVVRIKPEKAFGSE
jgi:transposase-like protein